MNAPNILRIVSDQERLREWVAAGFELPTLQGWLAFEAAEFATMP